MTRGSSARNERSPGEEPERPFHIVLNYRRDDTAGHAGHLYDDLADHFGSEHVFMDIDKIEPGVDFTEVIDRAVATADAFVALIGRQWLASTDAKGRRRLDNPEDYVRLEIEAALKRGIRVIPVLVQGVNMPASDDLPESLAALARRNALEIRDSSWSYDVERLIRTLEKLRAEKLRADKVQPPERSLEEVREPPERRVVEPAAPPVRPPTAPRRFRVPIAIAGVVGALVVAAIVVAAVLMRDDGGAVAASGGTIVYAQDRRIYRIDADGSGKKDLTGTDRSEDQRPEVSPDGSEIALARDGDIWVVDAVSGEGNRLTSGPENDDAPAWSPDGSKIAFNRGGPNGERNDIFTINASGSDLMNLTARYDRGGVAPDWSHDGREIVFQRRSGIWVMAADGNDLRQPGRRPLQQSPAWSPDGEKIAFAAPESDGVWDIYLMSPDGSDLENLTGGRAGTSNEPAWSPDGERVVFRAEDGIWAVNRDGSELEIVIRGEGLLSPSWGG